MSTDKNTVVIMVPLTKYFFRQTVLALLALTFALTFFLRLLVIVNGVLDKKGGCQFTKVVSCVRAVPSNELTIHQTLSCFQARIYLLRI